jgi:hypothetical protein
MKDVRRCAAEDPFRVEGRGWTRAADLAPGDRVANPDGTFAAVVSNEYEYHPAGLTVYNFSVYGDHTYFVDDGAGAVVPVWVHNTCAGRHHLIPRRFGSPIPCGSPKLTYYGSAQHTKLQRALDRSLKDRLGLASNASQAKVKAAIGSASARKKVLDDFYRDYSGGQYYKKFLAELAEIERLGGLR